MDPVIVAAFEMAISSAARFRGATAPNPPVGAATLDPAGRIVAVSAHEEAGKPHAETNAIAMHASKTSEPVATLIVTLEPCNHYGRTPPCTEAVLRARPQSVWIGALDPNRQVAGGGCAVLAAGGMRVHLLGDLSSHTARRIAEACSDLILPFSHRLATGRPWVTIRQILGPNAGMSSSLSRKASASQDVLAFAHQLRKRADVILTGSGTVLADWPDFSVRHIPDHRSKRRSLLICDRRNRVPQAYLEATRLRGLDAIKVTDIDAALHVLGAQGCLEVLVEAGPTLLHHVLKTDLWDEHIVIQTADNGSATIARLLRDGTRFRSPTVPHAFARAGPVKPRDRNKDGLHGLR
jgi:diaminohydroxyphosphoribosylaminopyrimidine deaminase / 5-amino-6-(5-phosphoribosylamino)uracil reductase